MVSVPRSLSATFCLICCCFSKDTPKHFALVHHCTVALLWRRGLRDTAAGPGSLLGRGRTAAVPGVPSLKVGRAGATAAEAVNLSDDDDDVVIIEEGMQPQAAKPAPFKQPGMHLSTCCLHPL